MSISSVFSSCCLACILSGFLIGNWSGYRQGQIDAMHGKWKYEIKNMTQVVEVEP